MKQKNLFNWLFSIMIDDVFIWFNLKWTFSASFLFSSPSISLDYVFVNLFFLNSAIDYTIPVLYFCRHFYTWKSISNTIIHLNFSQFSNSKRFSTLINVMSLFLLTDSSDNIIQRICVYLPWFYNHIELLKKNWWRKRKRRFSSIW